MFISKKWVINKWVKEAKGKRASDIILMLSFWNLIVSNPLGGLERTEERENEK